MSDPISLAAARADKSGDSRDWSVLDCLREQIRRIESGEIRPDMVFVAMSQVDDQVRTYLYGCAGGLKIEYVGLLTRHAHIIMSGE